MPRTAPWPGWPSGPDWAGVFVGGTIAVWNLMRHLEH